MFGDNVVNGGKMSMLDIDLWVIKYNGRRLW